jgi:hypothetical protein
MCVCLTPVHTRGRGSVADKQGRFEGCTALLPLLCGLTTRQLQVALLTRGGAVRAERAKDIKHKTYGDETPT